MASKVQAKITVPEGTEAGCRPRLRVMARGTGFQRRALGHCGNNAQVPHFQQGRSRGSGLASSPYTLARGVGLGRTLEVESHAPRHLLQIHPRPGRRRQPTGVDGSVDRFLTPVGIRRGAVQPSVLGRAGRRRRRPLDGCTAESRHGSPDEVEPAYPGNAAGTAGRVHRGRGAGSGHPTANRRSHRRNHSAAGR